MKHIRLLGVTINDRFSWSHYLTEVENNFINKLDLLTLFRLGFFGQSVTGGGGGGAPAPPPPPPSSDPPSVSLEPIMLGS